MTKAKVLIASAAVLFHSLCAFSPAFAAEQSVYQKALAAYNRGDYARVRPTMGQPHSADDYILLGRTSVALRLDDGVHDFGEAVKLDASSARTLGYLAMGYTNRHDFEAALNYITVALKKEPNNPELEAIRGRSLCKLGQEKSGMPLLKAAVAKAPNSPICLKQMALAAEEAFDTKGAEEYFSRLVKLEAGHVEPLLERAKVYALAAKDKNAQADFEAVLKINPDCQMAYLQRASYWKEKKDYKNMLADSKKCLACSGSERSVVRRAMRLKIDAEERLKQYSEAADDAKQLNGNTAGLLGSWGGRGDILRQASLQEKLGKYDEALKTIEPLYKMAPDRTEVMVMRARILGKSGQYAESLSLCNKLIARDANMPDWYRMRARAYTGLGKKEAAAQDIAKSKSVGEEFPDLPGLYQDRK